MIIPISVRCQLSHLDSTLAVDLSGGISQQVGNKSFTIAGESGMQALITALPHSAGVSQILQIAGISATVAFPHLKDSEDSSNATLMVNAHGTVITPGNSLAQPWAISRAFDISLTGRDRILLETNQDRYVSLEQPAPKSFWASTLEPALVVIGALAIVALFFIIRS